MSAVNMIPEAITRGLAGDSRVETRRFGAAMPNPRRS